jgi:DNA-binding MarR family transcriptional regulator/N-acetylglutamate synthase-like GNAT family acetyltransferase
MDSLKGFGELGLASRLKRISETLMKEIQLVYDYYQIDFDPYLFPVFKVIEQSEKISNSEITTKLLLTQPAVTQTVNRLLKKELVQLQVDLHDKRKKWITLSKKGKQLAKQLKPLWTVIDSVVTQYALNQSHSLIDQLNVFESKLESQKLSQMIIEKSALEETELTEIIDYSPEHKSHFYEYNIEWLETFFYVEDYDQEVLGNPEKYILNKGGHIFFIKYNEKVVGTVALMPTNNEGEFELTKLAVSPKYQGLKLGQKLMQHCVEFAQKNKFDRLMLYSNTKLHNSLYIFRKHGFTDVAVEENSPYARGNVKMIYNL